MAYKKNQDNQRRKKTFKEEREDTFSELEAWNPKTELGRQVKEKKITDFSQILNSGKKVMEPEIVDFLIPNLEVDFILIGQAKGKFGGGKRRIFRQTQKKTREGNKPIFSVMAIVGNRNGYIGIGIGKAKETLPAKEKAIRKAKLNMIQILRGCGSWRCTCGEPHSIPFKISGKESSVSITLKPAPKGTGLVVDKEIKKVLELAGIKDIWSKSSGQTRQKINFISALAKAFKSGTKIHIQNKSKVKFGAN